jgi:YVTN family beta-propeller protein
MVTATPHPRRILCIAAPIVVPFTVLITILTALLIAFPVPSADADPGYRVLRVRTFPPEAVLLNGDSLLVPRSGDGGWREYRVPRSVETVRLSAPGYRDRILHLHGVGSAIEFEERLVIAGGPLELVAEFPTGSSPKSVAFLPGQRLVVPLLRDRGVDFFQISAGYGLPVLEHLGLVEPREGEARRLGFAESLVMPDRRHLWVSQMEADRIHVYDLTSLRWCGSIPSGGEWPKVLATDHRGDRVYVANWGSHTIGVLNARTRTVEEIIPVGGQPRGLYLTDGGRLLWVCLFSTGDIEIVDTETNRVVDRLDRPPGAARHIVASPDEGTLYYTDMFHGTVNSIDAATRTVTASRRVGPNVNTIVADPRGRYLYVSVRGRNNRESYLLPGPEYGRIVVLDAGTLATIQTIWGRRQPTGLAVSPDGSMLVATDFLDDNLALYRVSW